MSAVFNVNDWIPARDAWRNFCATNSGFGLNGGNGSFVWFIRTYSQPMVERGALKKTVSRRWLANTKVFDQAAFDILTGEVLE